MKEIGCVTVGAFALVFGFVGIVVWISMMMSFPGELAQIEQLRADAAVVDPAQAEDVIGQVTQWNQTIVSNQAYNDMFLVGIFIPDEWDQIVPIPVPVER